MNAKQLGAVIAAAATLATLTACGSDGADDSSVVFSPTVGDEYTANPGAVQTDGVPVPEKGVTMVGDPVAAQAVANAGLQQGTVTASNDDTTVYYPMAPAVPGLPVAPQDVAPPPPPFTRPVNTRPWNYTQHQIAVYRQICETGRYNDWEAGVEVQSQSCWTIYGRQLGVRPWYPGQPKPWERPGWPKPWFEAGFRADVPVFWVYPKNWSKPRTQPLISVSIGLNVPDNPHKRPAPQFDEPYYPVWAVTPGRPVAARDQARVVGPWSPAYGSADRAYVAPPTYPGVVLAPLPTTDRAEVVTAVPGSDVVGNPYRDATVLVPTAAAIAGATVSNGSRATLAEVLGDDVDVTVATSTSKKRSKTTTTTTTRTSEATVAPATPRSTTAPSTAVTTTERTTTKPATTTRTTTAKSTSKTSTADSAATTTTKRTTTAPSKTTTTPKATTTPKRTTTAPSTTKRATTTKAATTTTTTPAR
ncbi:hypothetical protein [Tsukamurella sp. PLM1]|uniref:hypothetical protein n=1 Tax=Tsukamurella sp. PLM1 TaxID=2929795 RepID=UPI0020694A6D|nr:hypothetical protein [Tsukamurella sp. PLM1]BDH55123.1 hypothetical protein MTP03_00620 [Tsukamurella sp. PLM1]